MISCFWMEGKPNKNWPKFDSWNPLVKNDSPPLPVCYSYVYRNLKCIEKTTKSSLGTEPFLLVRSQSPLAALHRSPYRSPRQLLVSQVDELGGSRSVSTMDLQGGSWWAITTQDLMGWLRSQGPEKTSGTHFLSPVNN